VLFRSDTANGASVIVIELFCVCYIAVSSLLSLWHCVAMPFKYIYYFHNRLWESQMGPLEILFNTWYKGGN